MCSGDRAPKFECFLRYCVSEVCSYLAYYGFEVKDAARIEDGDVEQQRFILALDLLPKSTPISVVTSIRKGLGPLCCLSTEQTVCLQRQIRFCYHGGSNQCNGKSLSWMGLTRERWCCTKGLVSRLDMNTCQTSIKTDILLEHC